MKLVYSFPYLKFMSLNILSTTSNANSIILRNLWFELGKHGINEEKSYSSYLVAKGNPNMYTIDEIMYRILQ